MLKTVLVFVCVVNYLTWSTIVGKQIHAPHAPTRPGNHDPAWQVAFPEIRVLPTLTRKLILEEKRQVMWFEVFLGFIMPHP